MKRTELLVVVLLMLLVILQIYYLLLSSSSPTAITLLGLTLVVLAHRLRRRAKIT